ncbi:MAG: hypothetical protein GY822_30995 [Deltaproteobacteria bacterium]|nr:hypothetical protein [Deltaproteobacteria bacterium]
MSGLIDPFLLPLLLATPLLGALFVWVMPSTDRLTLRHMGHFASIFSLILAFRAGQLLLSDASKDALVSTHVAFFEWPLLITLETLPWLLSSSIVFAISLRAGAARVSHRMKSYIALMLLTQACVNGALLAQSPVAIWALMSLSTFPIAFILGVFGKSRRGESALSFIVVHGSFDALSLVALTWLMAQSGEKSLVETALSLDGNASLLVFGGLSLSALSRLLITPFSSWSRGLCDNAPISVLILVFCITPLLGASFWMRFSQLLPQAILSLFSFLAFFAAFASLLGGAGSLIDKEMRRYSLGVVRVFCSLSFLGFLSLDGEALWFSQAALCISSVAVCGLLVVLDSIDRRYVTLDSVELVGMRTQLPGLWRLLFASMASTLALPFVGAGLFVFRLVPLLGAGTVSSAAGLPKNAALFLTPIVLLSLLLLLVASSRHLRRTGSFPIGTTLATPSELNRGQALRLWIPLFACVFLGLVLLEAEHRVSPKWSLQMSEFKKKVVVTPRTQIWSEPAP